MPWAAADGAQDHKGGWEQGIPSTTLLTLSLFTQTRARSLGQVLRVCSAQRPAEGWGPQTPGMACPSWPAGPPCLSCSFLLPGHPKPHGFHLSTARPSLAHSHGALPPVSEAPALLARLTFCCPRLPLSALLSCPFSRRTSLCLPESLAPAPALFSAVFLAPLSQVTHEEARWPCTNLRSLSGMGDNSFLAFPSRAMFPFSLAPPSPPGPYLFGSLGRQKARLDPYTPYKTGNRFKLRGKGGS